MVLCTSGPVAARRCRSVAARASVELEREYLAIPSSSAPGCLVENAPAAVALFMNSILVVPPAGDLSRVKTAGVRFLRALGSQRLIRALAPGRVVVGWRA